MLLSSWKCKNLCVCVCVCSIRSRVSSVLETKRACSILLVTNPDGFSYFIPADDPNEYCCAIRAFRGTAVISVWNLNHFICFLWHVSPNPTEVKLLWKNVSFSQLDEAYSSSSPNMMPCGSCRAFSRQPSTICSQLQCRSITSGYNFQQGKTGEECSLDVILNGITWGWFLQVFLRHIVTLLQILLQME